MKKKKYIIFILIIFIYSNLNVEASSGRLKSASIKTCNGITYGQHSSDNHWHVASRNSNGTYSATGSPIYNDPCINSDNSSSNNSNSNQSSNNNTSNESNSNLNNNTNNQNNNITDNSTNSSSSNIENNEVIKEELKSNDNTLKEIIIDGEKIEILENIDYSTTKEKIDIKLKTTDDKATYEIKNESILSIGKNKISIEVTAEDGTIKIYNINVNREKILSSDTEIKVIIDGEEVKFDNYKATVYVESSTKNIKFDYTLSDQNARAEIKELQTLKPGDNVINIKVIAEDGTEQQYEIIIHKYSKSADTISNIIVFGIFGVIGYGIYSIINKKNKKKKRNLFKIIKRR